MNKRQLGNRREEQAVSFLRSKGYRILAQNFRCRQGEIDIIGEMGGCLVFFEVKYRSGAGCGDPAEAVDQRKQQRIYHTARYYLYKNGYDQDRACRFDVIALYGDGRIIQIENAFDAV